MATSQDDPDLRKVSSEADKHLASLTETSKGPVPSNRDHASSSRNEESINMQSVSERMRQRLSAIDNLVVQGYRVEMLWDAFPQLVSATGNTKNVWASSPAGFSWIAFFFPFAVCAQIREWSYFYVWGCACLAGSVFYRITGWDPAIGVSFALCFLYACIYPYLRWAALRKPRGELSVGISIVIGLLLNFLSVLPSIVFEAIFIG
jgi:hypothetical protein